MPELPDIECYIHALRRHFEGRILEGLRLVTPFLVRTFEPKPEVALGRKVKGFQRIGKRIVIEFDGEVFFVLHLMIAGRLRMKPPGAKPSGKAALLALDFEHATLMLTEAGTTRRASLHVVRGEDALPDHDPGGIEPLERDLLAFMAAMRASNHTVKRALTDPKVLSGIGNAYSDEILFDARMSPYLQTQKLSDEDYARLFDSTRRVLTEWRDRLIEELGDGFPDKVTAFRPEMNVHGRFKEPCRVCGTLVQRVRFKTNELNYCAVCQTGGKVLSDRSLSRLLKNDWQKTLEEG